MKLASFLLGMKKENNIDTPLLLREKYISEIGL